MQSGKNFVAKNNNSNKNKIAAIKMNKAIPATKQKWK